MNHCCIIGTSSLVHMLKTSTRNPPVQELLPDLEEALLGSDRNLGKELTHLHVETCASVARIRVARAASSPNLNDVFEPMNSHVWYACDAYVHICKYHRKNMCIVMSYPSTEVTCLHTTRNNAVQQHLCRYTYNHMSSGTAAEPSAPA
jgi:hypothetical protein